MALKPGDRIGDYQIGTLLGKGGMGEVYRAHDPKLGRDVAIKVLPASLVDNAERLTRFQREAKVLASLNHPNIAQVYGYEDDGSLRAIVMELVEGDTLADLIKRGPIPLDIAIEYAKQVLGAFEYAHDRPRPVIHRDLKPANVKVTPEGVVKVLDFGLAKALTEEKPAGADPENSPTLTLGPSVAGAIIGTAAYMSPEQAKGKDTDRRSDIWSFGVLLYEMLTGQRLFNGAEIADVLVSVIRDEPDLSKVPVRVRPAIERCIRKEPRKRWYSMEDVRFALDEPEPVSLQETAVAKKTPFVWMAATASALIAALWFGSIAYRHGREQAPSAQRLAMLLPEKSQPAGQTGLPAVSPDGKRIAVALVVDGNRTLWVRELNGNEMRQMPGTADGGSPFWSPDSRWLGFFAEGKLKKIDVTGGPAISLAPAPAARGGSWGKGDVILFGTQSGGIFRVAASGGEAVAITRPSGEETNHRAPWFLPDGVHFLYTARSQDPDKTRIYLASLDSAATTAANTRREIIAADTNASYVPSADGKSDYILFVRDRTLMALPFDADSARATGEPVAIAENVDYFQSSSQAQFSASSTGVLVFVSGSSVGQSGQLRWFDRAGRPGSAVGSTVTSNNPPRISPDGTQVAYDSLDSSGQGIWLADIRRGTTSRFLNGSSLSMNPVWSPDGSRLIYSAAKVGSPVTTYLRSSSGVGDEEPVGVRDKRANATDWSRDGRFLLEDVDEPGKSTDIWVVPTIGDKKPFPYVSTAGVDRYARVSPNGQWLAYLSSVTGHGEIYVETFPEHGGRWQVSANGGSLPVWSRDGRELFFISPDQKLMAVEIKGKGKGIEFGAPKTLFEVSPTSGYDVSSDGRFLIAAPLDNTSQNVSVTVINNWESLLKSPRPEK